MVTIVAGIPILLPFTPRLHNPGLALSARVGFNLKLVARRPCFLRIHQHREIARQIAQHEQRSRDSRDATKRLERPAPFRG